MKICDRISNRNNNFDFIRFLAATLVIFSHSFVLLTGVSWDPYLNLTKYDGFGSLAVNMFFIISGFLITKSWFDNSNWQEYLKKRILRIFPALFVVVFLTTFILGPLVTSLTLREYFLNSGTYDYLRNAILQIRFFLPGVYFDNPFSGGINGSLWTLPVEFKLYIAVMLFGIFRIFKFKLLILFLYILLICMYYFSKYGIYGIHFGSEQLNFIKCATYFSGGAILFMYKEKVTLNNKLFIFLVFLLFATFKAKIGSSISQLVLPYIVLFLAFYSNKFFENFSKKGDYSYGLYIYAFPVQVTLVHFFIDYLNTSTLFLSTFAITYLMAWFSWHYVEKPFMKLKSKSFKDLIGINFCKKTKLYHTVINSHFISWGLSKMRLIKS